MFSIAGVLDNRDVTALSRSLSCSLSLLYIYIYKCVCVCVCVFVCVHGCVCLCETKNLTHTISIRATHAAHMLPPITEVYAASFNGGLEL